jgi:hypothetical protein
MLNVDLFLSFKLLLVVLHRFFKSGKLTVHVALQVFLLWAVLLAEISELLAKILHNSRLFLGFSSRLAVIMVELLDQCVILVAFFSKSLNNLLCFIHRIWFHLEVWSHFTDKLFQLVIFCLFFVKFYQQASLYLLKLVRCFSLREDLPI